MTSYVIEATKTPPEDESEGAMTDRSSDLKGSADLSFAAGLDLCEVPVFTLAEDRKADPEKLIKGRYRAPKGYTSFTADGNAERLQKVRSGDALAMLCGVAIDVIDYDPRNDHEGRALELLRREGLIPRPLYVVQTPGGGWHIYIPTTGLTSGEPMVGVDFQARGRLVLIPGTEGYRLLDAADWPDLGEFPEDAVARLAASMARRPSLHPRRRRLTFYSSPGSPPTWFLVARRPRVAASAPPPVEVAGRCAVRMAVRRRRFRSPECGAGGVGELPGERERAAAL